MWRATGMPLLVTALLVGAFWLLSEGVPTRGAPTDRPAMFAGGETPRLDPARLLDLLASPSALSLLDGAEGPWGVIETRVVAETGGQRVVIRCSPCSLAIGWIGLAPLQGLRLVADALKSSDGYAGTLWVDRIAIRFRLTVARGKVTAELRLPATPIRDLYAVFASVIPELGRASIRGEMTARVRFTVPGGPIASMPVIHGFEVRGLGTEALAYGRFRFPGLGPAGEPIVIESGDGGGGWIGHRGLGRLLPNAVVASEDMRFFHHPGYDLTEVLAALASGSPTLPRGASTLTQQLAKNLFLRPEQNVVRKLRELLYAVEMEQTLGKKRILDLYLNVAEWGPGIYGAGQAARVYFGKRPAELLPEEAAWLAGILPRPHAAWARQYRLGRAEPERLQWVLDRMKDLTRAERRSARLRPVAFAVP